MSDRKLTDSEIVKAFECCYHIEDDCKLCPLYTTKECSKVMLKVTLDLINRLQAENERLDNLYKQRTWERDVFYHLTEKGITKPFNEFKAQIKAEAYKEFAEKTNSVIESLIRQYSIKDFGTFKAICQVLRALKNNTNNLLKEMVDK